MAEALLACPCCHGEAKAQMFTGGATYIICTECGLQTPFLKPDEAIRRWNARPPKLMNREREKIER